MKENTSIVDDFSALNEDQKIEYLRAFDGQLDLDSALFFTDYSCDDKNDDILRIETLKVLGLYKGMYDEQAIKKKLFRLIENYDDDDDVKIYAIDALARMNISDADIDFFVNFINSDIYILLKESAFALIVNNKNLVSAKIALESLKDNKIFGKSAERELKY